MKKENKNYNVACKLLNFACGLVEPTKPEIEKIINRYNSLTSENLTIEHCLTYYLKNANYLRREMEIEYKGI
jgi:hypothetical protein